MTGMCHDTLFFPYIKKLNQVRWTQIKTGNYCTYCIKNLIYHTSILQIELPPQTHLTGVLSLTLVSAWLSDCGMESGNIRCFALYVNEALICS